MVRPPMTVWGLSIIVALAAGLLLTVPVIAQAPAPPAPSCEEQALAWRIEAEQALTTRARAEREAAQGFARLLTRIRQLEAELAAAKRAATPPTPATEAPK